MKEPDEDAKSAAPLERILARDGFSPDLPHRGRSLPSVGLGLRLLMYMFRGVRYGRL